MRYSYNPHCSCSRCRAHGYMGPAVLITLGVLFLLDQTVHIRWMDFGSTWPALLIVIGLILFLEHSSPATSHIPPGFIPGPQGPVPGGPPVPPSPASSTGPPPS